MAAPAGAAALCPHCAPALDAPLSFERELPARAPLLEKELELDERQPRTETAPSRSEGDPAFVLEHTHPFARAAPPAKPEKPQKQKGPAVTTRTEPWLMPPGASETRPHRSGVNPAVRGRGTSELPSLPSLSLEPGEERAPPPQEHTMGPSSDSSDPAQRPARQVLAPPTASTARPTRQTQVNRALSQDDLEPSEERESISRRAERVGAEEMELDIAGDSSPAGVGAEIHARPASLASRFVAGVIDLSLLGTFFSACLWAAGEIASTATAGTEPSFLAADGALLPCLGLFAALCFTYGALFHALSGRTLGEAVVGITVLDARGKPPSLPRAMGRAALTPVSALPLMLGYVAAVLSEQRQALHDQLTGTYVVKRSSISGAPPAALR